MLIIHYRFASVKCFGGILLTIFAERLKEVRISRNITQKAVADYLGIQETSYQHYEYGKREPNFDTLVKLAKYFDVSSDYLLGLSDRYNFR